MGKEKSMERIQVFVRCRPLSNSENNQKCWNVVETPNNKELVIRERPSDKLSKTFTFDKVFNHKSKQVDVYKAVAAPLIEEVLNGYNCTVFAYGQTGTGKTFTMEGERCVDNNISWDQDPQIGIIPRTLSHLFDELRIQGVEYTMRVSFLELYNEEIFDLLSPRDDSTKLRLFEDSARKGSVIIQGLEEVTVHNKSEVYSILEKGSIRRQTACTLMNTRSSRSHTVFSVTLHIKENSDDGEELLKTGKLNLVDLAGSENIGRSGAVDKRAREAGNINQSLLTLGRVITSLVENAPHVPYRESKLTRLLQDSLGGRTKTSIIATISPASVNLEETLSTLDYAHRAKNITNRPEVNQRLTKKTLLKEYTEEIERLRRDLLATRNKQGVYLAEENYNEITTRLEQQEQELIDKIEKIKAVTEQMEKLEEIYQELVFKQQDTQRDLEERKKQLELVKSTLKDTEQLLKKTERQRLEVQTLLDCHVRTEEVLTQQAKAVLEVTNESTDHVNRLHSTLDRKTSLVCDNLQKSRSFHNEISHFIKQFENDLVSYIDAEKSLVNDLVVSTEKNVTACQITVKKAVSILESLQEETNKIANSCGVWQKDRKDQERNLKNDIHKSTEESQITLMSINKKLVDMLHELIRVNSDCHNEVLNSTKLLEKEVNNKINNRNMEAERTSKVIFDQLNELDVKMNAFCQEVAAEVQNLEKANKEYFNKEDLREHFIQKTLSDLQAAISSICQDSASKYSTYYQEACVIRGNNSKNYSHLVNYCNTQQTDMGNCIGSVTKQLHLAISDEKAKYNEISAELKACSAQQDKVVNNTCRSNEEISEQFFELSVDLGEKLANHNNTINSHVELSQRKAEVIDEKFSKNVNDCHESCHNMLHEVSENTSNIVAQLNEHSSGISHQCSMVMSALTDHQQYSELRLGQERDLLTSYQKGLKEDVRSGSTPQRQTWNYPKNLAATSPHERILQRIQPNSDFEDAVNLPLPDEDFSDPLITPPSEKQDSSDSASTSFSDGVPSECDFITEDKENSVPFSRTMLRAQRKVPLSESKLPVTNKLRDTELKSKRKLGLKN